MAIIMVTYGRAKLTEATLKSHADTVKYFPPFILIDNGSKQKTLDVIRDNMTEIDDADFWTENLGKPKAQNAGAKLVVDKYNSTHFLFCDNDIIFLPGWEDKILDAYIEAVNAGHKIGGLSGYNHAPEGVKPLENTTLSQPKIYPPGCCVFISREAFEEAGQFDESKKIWAIDSDLYKTLRRKGYINLQIYPESAIIHNGEGQRSFDKNTKEPIYVE